LDQIYISRKYGLVMEPRYLTADIEEFCFAPHEIALLSGPRIGGRLSEIQSAKDPRGLLPGSSQGVPLLVLDEIHKHRLWKRALKGLYDRLERPVKRSTS
jgi:hypothetical protein